MPRLPAAATGAAWLLSALGKRLARKFPNGPETCELHHDADLAPPFAGAGLSSATKPCCRFQTLAWVMTALASSALRSARPISSGLGWALHRRSPSCAASLISVGS